MSYREKTIWLSLAILVYLWGNYVIEIQAAQHLGSLDEEYVRELLFDVVIMTIIIEIVLNIILAILDHKQADEQEDERDKLISLNGKSNAYLVVCIGIFISVFHMIIPEINNGMGLYAFLSKEYVSLHLVIFFGVLAELVNLATQLFYYRRGF